MKLSQRVIRGIVRASLVPFLTCEIKGRENIPHEGPLVLVANHVQWLDPPLLGAHFPRWVHFVAKIELLGYPVLGRVIRWAEVVPLDRRSGVAEKRQMVVKAGQLLEQGLVVCLFPEGRRSRRPGLQAGYPGPVSLACKANVLLMPVGIAGSDKVSFRRLPWQRRPTVTLNFGRPFAVSSANDKVGRQESTKLMMIEIARLLPPEYRGQYGNRSSS